MKNEYTDTKELNQTHNCLPANLLEERIDDLADDLEADLRAADLGRIAVHTCLPRSTLRSHRRYFAFGAEVDSVGQGALRNLLHDVHGVLADAVLNVTLQHEQELNEDVQGNDCQRRVETKLHVAAKAIRPLNSAHTSTI